MGGKGGEQKINKINMDNLIECVGQNPVQIQTIDGGYELVPLYNETNFWQYSSYKCNDARIELIQDPASDRAFYVDKSSNYGTTFTNFLLIFIFVFMFVDFLFHLVLKRN
jgi:hypothetical protein